MRKAYGQDTVALTLWFAGFAPFKVAVPCPALFDSVEAYTFIRAQGDG